MSEQWKLERSWSNLLDEELKQPYMEELRSFLNREKERGARIYPPENLWFNAFEKTPFAQVKVVIVGQDPYHGEGQAEGLSFSVPAGVLIPPSLRNIFKELESDLRIPAPQNGSLAGWAKQGVLLLNATLTVGEGNPLSHHKKGWERFTDRVIQLLSAREDPLVFILWGKSALGKYHHAVGSKHGGCHLILQSPHPSPLGAYRGFFGSKPFSQTNAFLEKIGKKPIDWGQSSSLLFK